MGLIYNRPSVENSSFSLHLPDDGRSISRNVATKNIIQDMINSDNMNSTESTIPNVFKTERWVGVTCIPVFKTKGGVFVY